MRATPSTSVPLTSVPGSRAARRAAAATGRTASPRFLFLTHEMLSAARGEASLLAASIEDASALGTALRLATLIVADVRVHTQVRRGTQAEVIRLPLLADAFFDELARHLPAKARRR